MILTCRRATRADAAGIARIYDQGIAERASSFETRLRETADIEEWFESGLPIVVAEEGPRLVAFAASFQWRSHERYRGIVEVSIYVDRIHRGRGAGGAALAMLLAEIETAGLWKALAGVFPENGASIALLTAAGFRVVGTYEKQARLEGAWRDITVMEKLLATNQLPRVIFACVHNAGRSQMAAALFNAEAKRARAISAGTNPLERVHLEVVEAMTELSIDLSQAMPRKLTAELAQGAELLVTMGCGEACPVVPGLRREDWPLEDPKGKPIEQVRKIREEIRARVEALIAANHWR